MVSRSIHEGGTGRSNRSPRVATAGAMAASLVPIAIGVPAVAAATPQTET